MFIGITMKNLLLLSILLSSFSSFAETVTTDIRVKVSLPICRSANIVNTWDGEDDYIVTISEISQNGNFIKKIATKEKSGHVDFLFNLKGIRINSTSSIKVDVYEDDSWFTGFDDYYPVADVPMDEYDSVVKIDNEVYDTNIFYASLNSVNCVEVDVRETPDSVKRRNAGSMW
jgi:hypothetical protein